MSKTSRRRQVTADPNTAIGSQTGSQTASIIPDEFSQLLGTRLPDSIVKTANATIRPYQQRIKQTIQEACVNLPDPAQFVQGQRPVFQIYVSDISGSQEHYIGEQVKFENLVTEEVLNGSKPTGGVYVTRLVFDTRVDVVQPFRQVTDQPESQIWFAETLDGIDPQHHQFYHVLKSRGGTDLNLAVLTAFALAKYVDYIFRQANIIAKFVVVVKTDGGHNGSMQADHVKAAIDAAREFDNIYTFFVVIGDPQTAAYARSIGFAPDTVLEINTGAGAAINAAKVVSSVAIGASLSAVPASRFDYLSQIEQILSGEQLEIEQLQGGTQSNVFDQAFGLPEEVHFDDEEDGGN